MKSAKDPDRILVHCAFSVDDRGDHYPTLYSFIVFARRILNWGCAPNGGALRHLRCVVHGRIVAC
jgi:hypothetical protein